MDPDLIIPAIRKLIRSSFGPAFYLYWPLAIIGVELLVSGWENSSLRILFKRSQSVAEDYFYWALTFLKLNDIVITALTVTLYTWLKEHTPSLELLKINNYFAQFLVGFIATDFIYYWWHRATHSVPFLWAAHRIHHSATELNVLMTFRFHPIERFLGNLIGMAVFLVIGGNFASYATFAIVDLLLGQVQHARLRWNYGWLGKIIVSPTFHRLHHSNDPMDYNRNYAGRLVIWDQLFGTYSEKDIGFDELGVGKKGTFWEEFSSPFVALIPRLLPPQKSPISEPEEQPASRR